MPILNQVVGTAQKLIKVFGQLHRHIYLLTWYHSAYHLTYRLPCITAYGIPCRWFIPKCRGR
jgi:hypothetical protein